MMEIIHGANHYLALLSLVKGFACNHNFLTDYALSLNTVIV